MFVDNDDVMYYLTLYNENYVMPPAPDGVDTGIIEGMYRWADAPEPAERRATILFSGTAHTAVAEARDELAEHFGVGAETWSVTSYKRLREDALAAERWNRLHPMEPPRRPMVTDRLDQTEGPIIAVTDFMCSVPDQISRWAPRRFVSLGTDGFGRSDARAQQRQFFAVDAPQIVVAVLAALAECGDVAPGVVAGAIERYGIDPDVVPPWESWPAPSDPS